MTPENTRIETNRQNGKVYKGRRCKRCQSIRVAAYMKARRAKLRESLEGTTHRAGRISEQ